MSASKTRDNLAVRQYFVSVNSEDAKWPTLVDLIQALGGGRPPSIVIVCCGRDALDKVCGLRQIIPFCQLWLLHSDLSESETATTIKAFCSSPASSDGPRILAATDASLGGVKGPPIDPSLRIDLDPPASRAALQRRAQAVHGGRAGAAVSLVVGPVDVLNVEAMAGHPLLPMPLIAREVLRPGR